MTHWCVRRGGFCWQCSSRLSQEVCDSRIALNKRLDLPLQLIAKTGVLFLPISAILVETAQPTRWEIECRSTAVKFPERSQLRCIATSLSSPATARPIPDPRRSRSPVHRAARAGHHDRTPTFAPSSCLSRCRHMCGGRSEDCPLGGSPGELPGQTE